MVYDVIIVGGGPAGMSAALILARCRRRILMFDDNKPRNRWADSMNGFLSRDGIAPEEFKRVSREELSKYGVKIKTLRIVSASRENKVFTVKDEKGASYQSKKLLIATGLTDKIPAIEGLEPLYGKSVHHCPYCDGWEQQDKRLAAYGVGKHGYGLAKGLLNWSKDIVLCTDGPAHLQRKLLTSLEENGIRLITKKIRRLKAEGTQLKAVEFEDGEEFQRDALFFGTGYTPSASLHIDLGCNVTRKGEIIVDKVQQSSVEGLYVSGDAAYEMKLVIIAAGEGAKAGVAINITLMEEEYGAG